MKIDAQASLTGRHFRVSLPDVPLTLQSDRLPIAANLTARRAGTQNAAVMKRVFTAGCLGWCLLLGGVAVAEGNPPADDMISEHMVAQAMLTAYFIDAARKAGMDTAEINAVLAEIAEHSLISEFWISDETGQIAFSNIQGADFAFPTDPEAGSQAAPFAVLLGGMESVVVQDAQPRELDAALFKYVGVAGIDQPRIVQIGISGAELGTP